MTVPSAKPWSMPMPVVMPVPLPLPMLMSVPMHSCGPAYACAYASAHAHARAHAHAHAHVPVRMPLPMPMRLPCARARAHAHAFAHSHRMPILTAWPRADAFALTSGSRASTSSGYQLLHMAAGWSNAVSYGCHPEYGDVVAALNAGLEAFKATSEYASLCARYPDIPCDTRGTKFINTKTAAAPHVADHPKTRADISIVTESDWGQHNSVVNSVVGGFDVALTQAACALAGLTCALTTAPWQSVWSSSYGDFGWDKNAKAYAGLGHMKRCVCVCVCVCRCGPCACTCVRVRTPVCLRV